MQQNKTIIVTGCTKGIGEAICSRFASEGFNVSGCARSVKDLEKMQQEFTNQYSGQQFLFEACDVSDKSSLKIYAEKVLAAFGKVDVLVNNAGVFLPGNIQDEEDHVLETLLKTNVESAYHFTRALLPQFLKQKSGHIFNMCSIASLQAYPQGGSYAISKFALLGFSKQLRQELKQDNIKVTAVMPGATYTNSWAGASFPESRFIPARDIAATVFDIYKLSGSTDVEEIVIRPQLGDI